jgi:hypothetical protein
MIAVDLDSWDYLSVSYNLDDPHHNASIYVLEDCNNGNTCLASADEKPEGEAELLNYFNNDDEPKRVYLVLDANDTTAGTFSLDVSISQLSEPETFDTCAEVETASVPIQNGTYFSNNVSHADDLNPGTGGCTDSSLPGPDVFAKVVLMGGETIEAAVVMNNANPALYLTYNCSNAFSCVAGSDIRGDGQEVLTYTNTDTSSENLYLVLDTPSGMTPYFLTVNIY